MIKNVADAMVVIEELKQENKELRKERKLKVVAMADACVDTVTEYKEILAECVGLMSRFVASHTKDCPCSWCEALKSAELFVKNNK